MISNVSVKLAAGWKSNARLRNDHDYNKNFFSFFFFSPNQSEEAISFEELSYQSRQPGDAGG